MTSLLLRVVAAGALAMVLAAGSWLAGKPGRESAKRLDALRDGRADRAEAIEEESAVAAREARIFEATLLEDAQQLEVDAPDFATISAPNLHVVELQDALVLRPGESWSSDHLVVRAKEEKVTYRKHGASVAAPHVVAEIENVASMPVAYNVRVRSHERGRCDVRGLLGHNAVALEPGEIASIVVCAGRGSVRLEHVEVLELTPLGHRFVSGIPAVALGIDPVTAQAHRPPSHVPACETVDARRHTAEIQAGRARWVDVADFYSRHNCTRWQYVPGYRHATGPVARLPVTR